MGWDSFPTNDFRRCRFSRSAKPLGVLPIRTPRKHGRNAPEAAPDVASGIRPMGRNRAKPSHRKPNRDHSPDKSATSRDWPVPKRLEMAGITGEVPKLSRGHRLMSGRRGSRGVERPTGCRGLSLEAGRERERPTPCRRTSDRADATDEVGPPSLSRSPPRRAHHSSRPFFRRNGKWWFDGVEEAPGVNPHPSFEGPWGRVLARGREPLLVGRGELS